MSWPAAPLYGSMAESGDVKPAAMPITLTIKEQDGTTIQFKVKRSAAFSKFFDAFYKKKGAQPGTFRFQVRGRGRGRRLHRREPGLGSRRYNRRVPGADRRRSAAPTLGARERTRPVVAVTQLGSIGRVDGSDDAGSNQALKAVKRRRQLLLE